MGSNLDQVPALPLDKECPGGAHDHGESSLAHAQPLDTKSPCGQPPAKPVYTAHDQPQPLDTKSPSGQPAIPVHPAHDQPQPLDTKSPSGQPANHGKADSALSSPPDKKNTVWDKNTGPPTHAGSEPKDQFSYMFDLKHFRTVNSHIRHERFEELCQLINTDPRQQMNRVVDPVLIIIICAKKTQLAISLIDKVGKDKLMEVNFFGDTALHVAAAEGDTAVAEALLRKEPRLIELRNNNGETALHKAAMYGHEHTFWCLVNADTKGSMISSRKDDGSTVLHSAIMANAPKLALDIATRFTEQKLTRNEAALTPLQLVATLPNFFRSPLVVGSLRTFLYKLIPVEEDSQSKNAIMTDEEAGGSIDIEESYGGAWRSVRSKFPSEYTTILDLLELIARWFQRVVFNILKPFIPSLQSLEREKKRYVTAMKLVDCLAQTGYDFYCKGLGNKPMRTAFDVIRHPETKKPGMESPPEAGEHDPQHEVMQDGPQASETKTPIYGRWLEPPLIIAAELGQHDLVRKILHLCPESAIYLDSNDRNVVQVAILSGHKEVVSVISEIFEGKENPLLNSFVCSVLDVKSRNTVLHLAAQTHPAEEGDALQLHHELKWFEMVEKIVPQELVYSRNKEEKTAHELFTENHKKTLEECKKSLVELGKACAGLVAAAVFTSSFSIPTHKDNQSDKLAYNIYTHAYLIGFGCATTALVLFLSLVLTPYQERYFRRAIPRHFLLACLSFGLALVGFLISFACNFVLQIYGGQEMQKMQLVKLLLELLLFLLVCIAILLYSGDKLGPSFSRFWK